MTRSNDPTPPHPLSTDVRARLDAIWQQAYAARTRSDLLDLYSGWAATYDEDHEAIGFVAHRASAAMLAKYVSDRQSRILDAGAGTGAAGQALHEIGFDDLTAIDFSSDMLNRARQKGIYRRFRLCDLDLPLDEFTADAFDAAILVEVFSYGQAPAHALDEIVRVVRPGGVVVLTMRVDFAEENAMGVRGKIDTLERAGAWELIERSDPAPYLPRKDADALFQVWCFRLLPSKQPPVDEGLAHAVRAAWSTSGPVKRIDHRFIWDTVASRLYDRYIEVPEYYLNVVEEQLLSEQAVNIVREPAHVVELGCGSARKVSHLLQVAAERREGLTYIPIDLSAGAIEATVAEVRARFGSAVAVEAHHAPITDVLPLLAERRNKLIVFFGSSIGNIETLDETVRFLRAVRGAMQEGDRFVVGTDLDKDEVLLRDAYQAGDPNLLFFLNMVRRINLLLGGNFDLKAFHLDSSYDRNEPYHGIEDRCVNFKLVTVRDQSVELTRIGGHVELARGEAIQVGTSRKLRRQDIARLAELAGFALECQWVDRREMFALNALVRS